MLGDNQWNAPVTEEELAEIRRLHAEGYGRNDIARATGRSNRTISIHANRMGLTFDRTMTEAATAARRADLAARKADIISALYDIAEDEIAYLTRDGQYELVEVSSGQAVKYTTERLPAQDRRALINAVSLAVSTAHRMDADEDAGVADGISLVGRLAEGFTAAYRAMNEGAGDAP